MTNSEITGLAPLLPQTQIQNTLYTRGNQHSFELRFTRNVVRTPHLASYSQASLCQGLSGTRSGKAATPHVQGLDKTSNETCVVGALAAVHIPNGISSLHAPSNLTQLDRHRTFPRRRRQTPYQVSNPSGRGYVTLGFPGRSTANAPFILDKHLPATKGIGE